ncbi:MAG: GNAT family N-acetyltransferase [Planctomycetes bacterium]|nr:GNAT family N-acetyltransferase [Planctomycetota bacterium]
MRSREDSALQRLRADRYLREVDPKPVTLEGASVRLAPLAREHAEELFAAAQDDRVWSYMPRARPKRVEDVLDWIDEALRLAEKGEVVPFAQIERAHGRAIGSTRYMDLRRAHRGLEIGWTWIAPAFQRTAVNTEAKLLLLAHAFEALGALRVQLKTDARNARSQRAIERLGAVREGVLRQHIVCPDGFVRDSVMFSITRAEWPAVKARLHARLAQG